MNFIFEWVLTFVVGPTTNRLEGSFFAGKVVILRDMLFIPRGSDTKQRSEVSEEFPGRGPFRPTSNRRIQSR